MNLNRAVWKHIVGICKNVYTPLTLVCIVFVVVSNRALLVKLYSDTDFIFLITSVCLWTLLHLLAPFSPLLILKSFKYPLRYHQVLNIYISRLPARYLPGGIWHTVSRLVDYHKYGITKRHLTFLAAFEAIFPIPLTLFVGGSLVFLSSAQKTQPLVFTVALLIVCLGALLVPFFAPLTIFNKGENSKVVRTFYFCLLFVSFIFWIVAASSFLFYFYSFSLDGSTDQSVLSIAGAYVFSWGAGYIVFFAPQGIGVFEIVAGRMIDLPMSLGSSVAFLAGFRLVALVADIFIYLCYRILLVRSTEIK